MLTTGGFITTAREGRLPEPRLPHIPLPVQPHAATVSRSSGNSNRSSSSHSNSAVSATQKKKLSLERLMRHKNNLAIKKAAQNAMSGIGGSASSSAPKIKNSKKSLSHSAVLSMAGVGMDSSMCFTTKHGKSKDKVKPKIPPTPPGTNRFLNPSMLAPDKQQQFLNKTCSLPRHGTPSVGASSLALPPPPKLKIPTPKMKQPEFSTDVLPLPKEDLKEQQERKLQIQKKEEKQKELALAAKNGMLESLVTQPSREEETEVKSDTGQFPEISAMPAVMSHHDLINKLKKDKKEKESKKELKKVKDVRKDKDKRDKDKHEVKKEKGIKKKEDKGKLKERKGEKKKEKEAKKIKDGSKKEKEKDKDVKKTKDSKKNKEGKSKEKDPLKKDKELKKKKKPSVSGSPSMKSPPHPPPSKVHMNITENNSAAPPFMDSLHSNNTRQTPPVSLPVDLNLSSSTTSTETSVLSNPISPEANKSKLCVFKKTSKAHKDSSAASLHDSIRPALAANQTVVSSPIYKSFPPAVNQSLDLSADLSGVISSPSILETPTFVRPKKRKRPDDKLSSPNAQKAPKTKKIKREKNVGPPKGRSPKRSTPVPQLDAAPADIASDHKIESFTQGSKFMGLSNWDTRPPTPDILDTASNKAPLTPGMHPYNSHPLDQAIPPPLNFSSANLNMEPFGGGPHFSEHMERPVTPGQNLAPPMRLFDTNNSAAAAFAGSIPTRLPSPALQICSPHVPEFEPTAGKELLLAASHNTIIDVDKKKKEKEHRKERKEKIKKKKEKKDKAKLEKKLKEKGKKERKKKKCTGSPGAAVVPTSGLPGVGGARDDHATTASADHHHPSVSAAPTHHQHPPSTPKLVIKRSEATTASSSSHTASSFSVSATPAGSNTGLSKDDKPGSPELAKISALITRPPKVHSSSSSKEKTKSSSGSSSRGTSKEPAANLPVSSSNIGGGVAVASGGGGFGGHGSNSSAATFPSFLQPAAKPTDVVSIPSLKIKEVKSISGSGVKDREFSGRVHDSPAVATESAAVAAVSSMPLVPPLKIKNTGPPDDKQGSSKKSTVFGGTESHRASKPSKKHRPVPEATAAAVSGPQAPSSGSMVDSVESIGHFVDDHGNEVWICPTCGKQDDGSPMIGCDTCDDWYHWVCVGIQVPPNEAENWYCPRCLAQHKQRNIIMSSKHDKKKHHHRKKK
uniref:Transcription initiation factor TFIID subunit 3-like n=1 Tax=Hirondellea gigas TaxID=1518452 RepID=A0A2P2I1D5_9CRUS